jgi:hypothetical protein
MRDPRKAAVALAALLVCALAACGSSEAPGKAGASAAYRFVIGKSQRIEWK